MLVEQYNVCLSTSFDWIAVLFFNPLTSVKFIQENQVRIRDLVKVGPQVLRLKVADIVKHSRASEVSNLQPGSRALEAFGFLMLKYLFSHILETLFL